MRLVQFVSANGERRVGRVSDDDRSVQVLSGVGTTYELARQAAREIARSPIWPRRRAIPRSSISPTCSRSAACSRRSTIPIPRIA